MQFIGIRCSAAAPQVKVTVLCLLVTLVPKRHGSSSAGVSWVALPGGLTVTVVSGGGTGGVGPFFLLHDVSAAANKPKNKNSLIFSIFYKPILCYRS